MYSTLKKEILWKQFQHYKVVIDFVALLHKIKAIQPE